MENNTSIFAQIQFGSLLDELLRQDSVTNINCWYHQIIVTDNQKGEYVLDTSKRPHKEMDEYYDVIRKLPNRLANRMVVNYNEGTPVLDAEAEYQDIGRLRLNCIHESINGSEYPAISIRRTRKKVRITELSIMDTGYASMEILNLIEVLIDAGCNIMIAGITNSGKTELLRFMVRYIRETESIITIEDTREAYLAQNYPNKHILELKANEKEDFSSLIRACLRQNPYWICVSETRSVEVLDLLNAASTGHKMISTLHADSAFSIPSRMVAMARPQDGSQAFRFHQQVYENVDIGIYIHYYDDSTGSHRKIAEIAEYYMDENNQSKSHLLVSYDFGNGRYQYYSIQSNRIFRNIHRRGTSCSKIEGVFIDET